jgi:peptide/nickel transport system permease protein
MTVTADPELAGDEGHAAAKKRAVSIGFWLAVAWLVLLLLVAILGEALPFVDDPNEKNAEAIRQGPSWDHWFGTGTFGQDTFSQVAIGARVSLRVAFIATAISTVIGGTLGLLAGYLRGWVDSGVRLLINATLSIPALLLVIFVVSVRGQSLTTVIAAVCILAIPALARVVRTSTLQVVERDFVRAAEVIGMRRTAILFREVLPNVMPALVSFALLTAGIILVVESTLAFLNLSVPPPTITWGSIIAEGRVSFDESAHMVFMPALVLILTVLSLNFVGDHLLKRYDVRESLL